jgi:hypothetical protein
MFKVSESIYSAAGASGAGASGADGGQPSEGHGDDAVEADFKEE